MTKKGSDFTIIVADYSSSNEPLSFDEFIEITHLTPEDIYQYIDYDIIHPSGEEEERWLFDLNHIKRVQRAHRLQNDLEVNLAGVAVVLDLLDEMDQLRERIKLLERLYL